MITFVYICLCEVEAGRVLKGLRGIPHNNKKKKKKRHTAFSGI